MEAGTGPVLPLLAWGYQSLFISMLRCHSQCEDAGIEAVETGPSCCASLGASGQRMHASRFGSGLRRTRINKQE